MKCVKCSESLVLNDAEGHIGYVCQRCKGIWLPSIYLNSLQHMYAFDSRKFMADLASSKFITHIKQTCPSCNQSLSTSLANEVELEWCEKCGGVWFDHQELAKLVTHNNFHTGASEYPIDLIVFTVEKFTDAYVKKHPENFSPQAADIDGYTPNHIPKKERIQNLIFSILLSLYGTFGVYINDLYIPGKRGGTHLHDLAAWVMYAAFICACAVMIAVIVDHYDRRNNETNYRFFAKTFKFLGWFFFVLSLILMIAKR